MTKEKFCCLLHEATIVTERRLDKNDARIYCKQEMLHNRPLQIPLLPLSAPGKLITWPKLHA